MLAAFLAFFFFVTGVATNNLVFDVIIITLWPVTELSMRMLREGAGLDSQATAGCCPTVCLRQAINQVPKKRLGKRVLLGLPLVIRQVRV